MAIKLTKRLVDAAGPGPARYVVWDSEVKGFGLRVTPAGAKTYVLKYRTRHGRTAPTNLIAIGQHGSPWTPETARAAAFQLKASTAQGENPLATRYGHQQDLSVPAVIDTFMARHHAAKGNRSIAEIRRLFAHDVLPAWQRRRIGDITRTDVQVLLDSIAARGATIVANRVLVVIHKLFNWCVDQGLVATNPAARLTKPGREVDRDRVLSEAELRWFWQGTMQLGWPFGPLLRVLALTAQRREEVAGMRWSELDLDNRLWALPAARAKNNRAHEVPLAPAVIAILESLPRAGDLVFSTTGRSPVSGFSRIKARLDQSMAATAAGEGVPFVGGWRIHDLRRTATTGMARLGHPPHVVDKVLNHSGGTIRGVAAVYNRFGYLVERRAALEDWANFVTRQTDGENV